MESQNGVPHDPEIMDFDTELVTFSPSSRPPCNLTATVSGTIVDILNPSTAWEEQAFLMAGQIEARARKFW